MHSLNPTQTPPPLRFLFSRSCRGKISPVSALTPKKDAPHRTTPRRIDRFLAFFVIMHVVASCYFHCSVPHRRRAFAAPNLPTGERNVLFFRFFFSGCARLWLGMGWRTTKPLTLELDSKRNIDWNETGRNKIKLVLPPGPICFPVHCHLYQATPSQSSLSSFFLPSPTYPRHPPLSPSPAQRDPKVTKHPRDPFAYFPCLSPQPSP